MERGYLNGMQDVHPGPSLEYRGRSPWVERLVIYLGGILCVKGQRVWVLAEKPIGWLQCRQGWPD